MKKLIFILAVAGALHACKNQETTETAEVPESTPVEESTIAYKSYGDEISAEGVIDSQDLMEKYKAMEVGDTLDLKVVAKVNEVCQNKGCWMKVAMEDEEAMVRFKDYGFFMPKDIAGKDIIAEGKAFIEEMSVDAQRHYAEDGGATPEEIAAITEPKLTHSFLAHGVLISESDDQ